ncbi:MAG: hypothetical protein ABEJ84_05450 [Halodesulfurarchaeum sp.]
MAGNGIETSTVVKVLLAVAAAVIAFVIFGSILRIVGRLIWLLAGLMVLVVLVLLALRLLGDLL